MQVGIERCRQRRDRRGVEEQREGPYDAVATIQLGHDRRRPHGITAEGEEVVVESDICPLEGLPPEDKQLSLALGGVPMDSVRGYWLRLGQRTAVDLAIGQAR